MTQRDPLRDHHAIPRGGRMASMRPTIDRAMQFAAQHGRYWNPIGVALLFVIVIAAMVIALEYTDAGKMIVGAIDRNTAESKSLRLEMAEWRTVRAEDRKLLEKIDRQLEVSGKSDATTRLVRLEKNDLLIGKMLVALNGVPPNASFPDPGKYGFIQPRELPEPSLPQFETKYQWAIKPE